MCEENIKIELSGVLGKKFGKVHYRFVSTIGEVARALSATIPGFEKYMINSEGKGLTFAVYKDNKNIGKDDLGYPVNGKVIRIVPVIKGSKKAGLLQTILGAVLVTVGAVMTIVSGGTASPLAAGLMTSGIGMMAGGVIQMLSPQPAGLASKQSDDNKASYAFGSVTNTASQGYPVPLGYGRRRIGGAIISAGIYVEDQQ
ncbi:TPA: tail assembly protein [Klebsiella variicola]|nr:tail assembly protein [Klebsiella variicola]HCI9368112.1 tail assembly protein [Klebsiella variicola]